MPLESPLLAGLPGLEHGFGTRRDGPWTPVSTARLRQTHSATVIDAGHAGELGEGDALITATPGLWLEVRTADCVPILLVDTELRVIAAIHAGWRGTAAKIAVETISHMSRQFGTQPGNLRAVIGPSIGPCCFEVGPEVAAIFPQECVQPLATGEKAHLDLVTANRLQLAAAGVPDRQLEALRLCTVCLPDQFHSFRRDKGSGRMVSAIRIAY